jgi:quercetin dioxygenase-like cupin family protein
VSRATIHRWDELTPDVPMPMLERRRIIGEQAMISRVQLETGCVVPTHSHQNEQFACLVSGRMKFGIGHEGEPGFHEVILEPGEILHLPSMLPHSAVALVESVILDIFSPPSATTGIDRS